MKDAKVIYSGETGRLVVGTEGGEGEPGAERCVAKYEKRFGEDTVTGAATYGPYFELELDEEKRFKAVKKTKGIGWQEIVGALVMALMDGEKKE